MNQQNIAPLIWNIADLLLGGFQTVGIWLPFTVW